MESRRHRRYDPGHTHVHAYRLRRHARNNGNVGEMANRTGCGGAGCIDMPQGRAGGDQQHRNNRRGDTRPMQPPNFLSARHTQMAPGSNPGYGDARCVMLP